MNGILSLFGWEKPARGWLEVKNIGGGLYVYHRWREAGGNRRQTYLGPLVAGPERCDLAMREIHRGANLARSSDEADIDAIRGQVVDRLRRLRQVVARRVGEADASREA
jgi:hypothetical protein